MGQGSGARPEERRRFPRHPCRGAAEVFVKNVRAVWGIVTDVSRGGCYIETAQPLPRGTEVQLRLNIADVSLDIGAEVATSDPLVGMGMAFVLATSSQKDKIAAIIDALTGARPSPPAPPPASVRPAAAHPLRIPNESAPAILAEVIKHLNEKSVLTRQDFVAIVKAKLRS